MITELNKKLLKKRDSKKKFWNKTTVICKEVDEMPPCTDKSMSSQSYLEVRKLLLQKGFTTEV
ncbi:hypothetical protein DU80_14320 [Methanosarcina mazei]|uniref:Uncharacterized protein n=1 Tax=Methanosarcina mazei TaxID=2209 RepID=A0A0F8DUI8_METMZ|nr:hypothetical protein DU47_13915 [Methanosarcina mazei]KKH90484.1 hypothetical protein DU80_14320 [Methanosarcina mazei]